MKPKTTLLAAPIASPMSRFPTMKLRIMAEIRPSATYAVLRCSIGKSITVAERTCCCQVSMKYVRNGMKDAASMARADRAEAAA